MEKIDFKTDERFNIVNIAIKSGIKIIGPVRSSNRVLAICPFCDDNTGHLYLTLENGSYYNVFKCEHCGEKGTAIDLYAKLHGINKKEAFKEILGNTVSEKAVQINKRIVKQRENLKINETKEIEYLDKVYNAFLDLLTLSEIHRKNLIERGLPEDVIINNKYKSIPRDYKERQSICKILLSKYDLKGVPGFFINDYGYWDMYSPKGFLVPVKSLIGEIQALQIRLDKPIKKRRYKYFSSGGFNEGAAISGHIHVSWGRRKEVHRIVITEGPLKGDVSTYFTGLTFLCVPGVRACIPELIDTLKLLNPDYIDVAFDMDAIVNEQVKKALEALKKDLYDNNFRNYRVVTWDANYKGIDDYLNYINKKA